MNILTRFYDQKGSLLEQVDTLDLGVNSSISLKDPKLISLKVDGVLSISGISLEVVTSQNMSLDDGFISYYHSFEVIEDFDGIEKISLSLNDKISLRNRNDSESEYVYLWIDPTKTSFRGDAIIRFKWNFDSVEQSSSSSSSSSCAYGEFLTVLPFQQKYFSVDPCEPLFFNVYLDPGQYTTLFFDTDPIVLENNGDTLIVNDIPFPLGAYQYVIQSGSNQYSVYVTIQNPYFIRIYRIGNCIIDPHLLLTNGSDVITSSGNRIILLEGSVAPPDALLFTTGENVYYMNGFSFSLLTVPVYYGSSSSSSSGSYSQAFAVYGYVAGSWDYGNHFIVPKAWFGNSSSPYGWDLSQGWSFDSGCNYGRFVIDLGQSCLTDEDCSNISYTFDWNSIPPPPDCTPG